MTSIRLKTKLKDIELFNMRKDSVILLSDGFIRFQILFSEIERGILLKILSNRFEFSIDDLRNFESVLIYNLFDLELWIDGERLFEIEMDFFKKPIIDTKLSKLENNVRLQ